VLCRPLDRCGATDFEQTVLRLQELLDTAAQQRPVFLPDREVPSEIQDGNLANFAPDALAAHQTMRKVRLVAGGAVGLGSTNKHSPILPEIQEKNRKEQNIMAQQNSFKNTPIDY
jgi:hypothetical protein